MTPNGVIFLSFRELAVFTVVTQRRTGIFPKFPKGIQRAASAMASDAHDRHRQDGNALPLCASCRLQLHRRPGSNASPDQLSEILQLARRFLLALLSFILQEVSSGAHGSLYFTDR